ncbi:hypothetical protein BH23BAC1_BH23BAC1_17770 [soil metagenome]
MGKDTSQNERIQAALHPDSFKVDERSIHDLYSEAQKLAEALNFYETADETAFASWSAFFEDAASYIQKLEPALLQKEPGICPPHLALFLAFLKLFSHTQNQLNKLTSAHLHFFYHKILGQERKGIRPDKAYIFFGLARNTAKYLLPQGTTLLAGKDTQGNDIVYTTDRDLFINHVKISSYKAIHRLKEGNSAIYAYPVANSPDGLGTSLEEGQGWYPFGNPGRRKSTAVIGFGVSSPMLFLVEGIRKIQLSFTITENKLSPEINNIKPEEFQAQLTGAEQWFNKEVEEVKFQDGKLIFIIQINEVDPPVTDFNQKVHGDPITSLGWPMLKIILREGFTYNKYAFIQSLQFSQVTIKTTVEKARNILVRNDYGDLDANKAFHPFGYNPVIGANLYLGMEEAFYKPITAASIEIKWKGLPGDFKAYYEGYLGATNSLVRTGDDFKVNATIRYQRSWIELNNPAGNTKEFPLFDKILQLSLDAYPKENVSSTKEPVREDGLIRLTLSSPSQAFGHTLFPTVYTKAIMAQLQDKASPIPHEPYTPIIDSVELSYEAEEHLDLKKEASASFRFFHLEPFGISEKSIAVKNSNPFSSEALLSGALHYSGSLYLGLENLYPPQQLSLFFEIAEENITDKPGLLFHYLGKSGWRRLAENQVLSDTTLGLKQTGILSLNLPADLTSDNSIMPPGYHWIRISVSGNFESFDRILNVRTNAVTSTLNFHSFSEGLEVNTLPPGSINKFVRKIAEIKLIEQPYSPYGGRPEEKKIQYFTRVSEKLQHKMRGITSWDMERLILEEFPEIYKVKCIPHADPNGMPAPGNIHIIVIPIIKYNRLKILKPLVSSSTLSRIRDYIAQLASPHTDIIVTNPDYEEIKVEAVINFQMQVDAGFYIKQLQADLQYFLSPWAFKKEGEIQLGNKLYRSSIIEFIESRHYVNFIASIKLLKNNRIIQDHEISPDERTIIVSADMHKIEAISSDKILCQTNQGIEQMIIDINFEIQ